MVPSAHPIKNRLIFPTRLVFALCRPQRDGLEGVGAADAGLDGGRQHDAVAPPAHHRAPPGELSVRGSRTIAVRARAVLQEWRLLSHYFSRVLTPHCSLRAPLVVPPSLASPQYTNVYMADPDLPNADEGDIRRLVSRQVSAPSLGNSR